MKKFLLSALAVGISISGMAQRSNIEFEEYTLDNGLHVILHQDNTTPNVTVSVLYHVGSKNEVLGRTGFAHFFEHLLFEGSENIGRGEYMKIIQANGGALNANTSQDRTFYYEVLPSNQLQLGLWMESERMLHAKIDQEGVDTQREVVKEEKRMRIDNQPYASFMEKMFGATFDKHPYHWVPIGSMEDLNAAQLSEFLDFYHRFYVPNNATLSIAGDIDMKQTKEWIKMYFGDIPRGADVIQPNIVEEPKTAEIIDTVYDNIQVPAIFVGYRIPGETNPDTYALTMLTTVLADGKSSRMYKNMVDEQQIALQSVAFPYALEDYGIFIALALVNGDHTTADLLSSLDVEVNKLQTELISDEEYNKVLNKIEADFITSNSSTRGIAESLANYHVYYGDANLINTELERYRKVTKEDIQRVAKQYLVKTNRVVLNYLPKSQEQAAQ